MTSALSTHSTKISPFYVRTYVVASSIVQHNYHQDYIYIYIYKILMLNTRSNPRPAVSPRTYDVSPTTTHYYGLTDQKGSPRTRTRTHQVTTTNGAWGGIYTNEISSGRGKKNERTSRWKRWSHLRFNKRPSESALSTAEEASQRRNVPLL
jgi:hypothetical protein